MYNRLSSRSRRLLLSVVVLLVAISSASAARPPKCPTAHSTNVEICEYVLDQARQFKDSNEQAEYVADVAGLYQRWIMPAPRNGKRGRGQGEAERGAAAKGQQGSS